MSCVYFVRHGETVWNVENKICGATDIDLTDKGHEQAVETGKRILAENIKADKILYSPLVRAKRRHCIYLKLQVFLLLKNQGLRNRILADLRAHHEMAKNSELPKASSFADTAAANLCCTLRREFTICLTMLRQAEKLAF